MSIITELRSANTSLTHRAANVIEVLERERAMLMRKHEHQSKFSFAPWVAACATLLLVLQTVLFGIAWRTCEMGF